MKKPDSWILKAEHILPLHFAEVEDIWLKSALEVKRGILPTSGTIPLSKHKQMSTFSLS